jgi:hypothetical protein
MINFLEFLIHPNQFYKKILDGKLKVFILALFITNLFLIILWEINIGLPLGNYEIYFFENKLLDSIVSATLHVFVALILAGALYLFTVKHNIINRFEKSYLTVFSLATINILAIIFHLITYYFFKWLIPFQILFTITITIQLIYFFIGIRKVFAISNLETLFLGIKCIFTIAIVIFILLYAEGSFFNFIESTNNTAATADRSKNNSLVNEEFLFHTVNKLKLRDKSYVDIVSEIYWRISNPVFFNKSVGNVKLAESYIRDIYETVMSKILLFHIYTENGKLEFINDEKKDIIKSECNQSKLLEELGIEIISLDIRAK